MVLMMHRDVMSRSPEHDMECLAALVVTGLGLGVIVDGLHFPLSVLEHHLLILVLLGVHLLFALPLAGRRAFLARLLLLLVELFHKLLDFLAITHTVACGVMYRASCATVIAARHLMGVLVASWASASTGRSSSSCGSGGAGQRLVVATGFLLLVPVVVAAALGVRLVVLPYPQGR
jgi:hypothetical protein